MRKQIQLRLQHKPQQFTSVGNSLLQKFFSLWLDKQADSDGSLRTAQWSKTDGTGVCPVGFRVQTELKMKLLAENTNWSCNSVATAFY